MISYEVYKVLHVFSVVLFTAMAAIALFNEKTPKAVKIILGVCSLFILVGGMGLLARIGISHGEGFPGWVIVKMFIWLVLAGLFGFISKRGVQQKVLVGTVSSVLLFVAIFMAVFKSV